MKQQAEAGCGPFAQHCGILPQMAAAIAMRGAMESGRAVVLALLLSGTMLTQCTAGASSGQPASAADGGGNAASIVAADVTPDAGPVVAADVAPDAGPVVAADADPDAEAQNDAVGMAPDAGPIGATDVAPDAEAQSDAAKVPDAVLTMTGLKVVSVPTNLLACRVHWDSNFPADSVVSFGASAFSARARDDQPALHHDVLVYGLHAQTTYKLRAKSTAASGKSVVGNDLAFTTAPLPEGVQVAEITVAAANPNPMSWYLTSLHLGQPAIGATIGYPRWRWRTTSRGSRCGTCNGVNPTRSWQDGPMTVLTFC